ncbi:MAG TPA: hypothetical protein VHP11_16135 [Tepidisphaeraceae bacterium]|nr:hypothetical protein [Tepidisphaeraceae bacterium]
MGQWFEQARQFTEMWTEFASKATSATMAYEPSASPPDAFRQVRAASFRAMSQFADQLMRWPQFLAAMRQSMDSASTYQKQMNDYMTAMRHNTQGVARDDIDSVLQSLEHLETRLLDRLEELSERLDDLDRRVASAERGGEASDTGESGTGRRQSRRPRDEKEA